jgi:serine/threonine-protein kinase
MSPTDYQNILSAYKNPILLKQGGQKVVYRVTHPDYGDIALKIGTFNSPQGLERIQREVDLLKDIDSKYYPKNFAFDILPPDKFVIVEEYVESRPLSNCFSDQWPPKKIVELVRHLVLGLKIIWDKRTVHRDIKPDNILITSDGTPKIIDLGIARLLDLESLTRTLAMRGPCTPVYAAPEQLSNRKTKIDFRTDQFNLGIIMLQLLLNGEHPFDPSKIGGTSIGENIISNKWDRSVFQNNDLKALELIISRLLGTEPYQRYRKDSLLLNDLDALMEVYR